jgi:hypothetical protein
LEIEILKLKDLKLLGQVLTDYRVTLEIMIFNKEISIREKVKINLLTKKIFLSQAIGLKK